MWSNDSLKSRVRALTWILSALIFDFVVAVFQLWLAGNSDVHITHYLAFVHALVGGPLACCAIALVISIRNQMFSRSISA